jgi:hypothetical protein
MKNDKKQVIDELLDELKRNVEQYRFTNPEYHKKTIEDAERLANAYKELLKRRDEDANN